jgi:ribosomal protein L2
MLALRGSAGLLRTCSSLSPKPFTGHAPIFRQYATEAKPPPSDLASAMVRTTALYKTYKPVTPGIRHLRRPLNPHLWGGKPVRALTLPLRKKGGRNANGRITVRSRGGGHKRRIRIVDFARWEPGVHDVVRIEYDPGRSGHIALVKNRNEAVEGMKKWSYILAPEGLRAGDQVQSFRQGIPKGFIPGFEGESNATVSNGEKGAPSTESLAIGILRAMTIKPGNVLPLRLIPSGTIIHNVALQPEGGGKLVRSAGTWGQVVLHEVGGKYTQVRLQSGEVRKVMSICCATIGKVSNPLHKGRSLGKAGRSRWLGRRPHVRGVAMNKCVSVFFKC